VAAQLSRTPLGRERANRESQSRDSSSLAHPSPLPPARLRLTRPSRRNQQPCRLPLPGPKGSDLYAVRLRGLRGPRRSDHLFGPSLEFARYRCLGSCHNPRRGPRVGRVGRYECCYRCALRGGRSPHRPRDHLAAPGWGSRPNKRLKLAARVD